MPRGVYQTVVGRGGGGGHGGGGHGHGHGHPGFHGRGWGGGPWGGWGGWGGWNPGWDGYDGPDDDDVLPHWQSPRFFMQRHRRRIHALLGRDIS